MKVDIAKFSWAEMCNNSKGKTSASLFCGLVILLVCALSFFLAASTIGLMLLFKYEKNIDVINFFSNLLMQSIGFSAVGASLLGIHRLSKDKPVEENKIEEHGTSQQ